MRFLVNVLAAFGKQAAEASDIDITDLLVAVAFNYQAVQGVRAKALVRVATLPGYRLSSLVAALEEELISFLTVWFLDASSASTKAEGRPL